MGIDIVSFIFQSGFVIYLYCRVSFEVAVIGGIIFILGALIKPFNTRKDNL